MDLSEYLDFDSWLKLISIDPFGWGDGVHGFLLRVIATFKRIQTFFFLNPFVMAQYSITAGSVSVFFFAWLQMFAAKNRR